VRLIREELELAMALAGCARIADIDAQALFTPATGEAPRSIC
jgi:isopentenyl diphosphate isomerase/L-lactate dehydrogenase-like FMN-dependent dehydrogenase